MTNRPFDLEAAKRGEPLVTRDGRKARFVGYVPEALHGPVVAYIEGETMIYEYSATGRADDGINTVGDLFMAPKPPRKAMWLKLDNGDTILDVPDTSGVVAVPKSRTVVDCHTFNWPADAKWPWGE
jgi:hypothetical protein